MYWQNIQQQEEKTSDNPTFGPVNESRWHSCCLCHLPRFFFLLVRSPSSYTASFVRNSMRDLGRAQIDFRFFLIALAYEYKLPAVRIRVRLRLVRPAHARLAKSQPPNLLRVLSAEDQLDLPHVDFTRSQGKMFWRAKSDLSDAKRMGERRSRERSTFVLRAIKMRQRTFQKSKD